jgi:hypothetical protein
MHDENDSRTAGDASSSDSRRRLCRAIDDARTALLSLQRQDGHWCGELQGDSILCSEYLLMKFILRQERAPMYDGRDGWPVLQKIANCLRSQQRKDGTWGQYPGAKLDLSATVKAYFATPTTCAAPAKPCSPRVAPSAATPSATSTSRVSARFHGGPAPPFRPKSCICRIGSTSICKT